MKRRLLFYFITFIYVLNIFIVSGDEDVSGGIKDNKPIAAELFNSEIHYTDTGVLDDGETIALQFYATTQFTEIELYTLNQNKTAEYQISIYQWDTNYEKSVRQTPLATKKYKGHEANAWIKLAFDPLASGEYVWELRAIRKGFYVETLDGVPNVQAYRRSLPVEGSYRVRVKYVNTPNNLLHTISESYVESRTTPPQPKLDKTHPINEMNVRPDTWVAIDGLGRKLSDYKKAGSVKKDKFVGIFYWTWHDHHAQTIAPRNVQRLLDSLPEEEAIKAKNDFYHPVWEGIDNYHFWNEPVFGYYSTTDKYVLRKHAEMLADAGVDVVIFDNTNGQYMWQPSYYALLETFAEARQEGVKTPQVSFMLNFGPQPSTAVMLEKLYLDIYRAGKFQDLWFYWEGKPMLMAHQTALNPYNELHAEILDFFTFRNNDPSYFTPQAGENVWGWLSIYPQTKYNPDKSGRPEQMTVGVAQNATADSLTAMNGVNVLGRSFAYGNYSYSYTYRDTKIKVHSGMENSKLYGINFQQQWDYAIANDPDFIFVTGWNEWVAIRFKEWANIPNGMADQFNDEYSRDIEPSTGELQDHYYYQLVENIRRFKGVSKPEKVKAKKSIDIFGSLSQWDNISSFNHYINNTWDRDYNGYKTTHYTNHTMRNDIKTAKVAFDKNNIYFYVETVDNLTPYTDPAWMRLFIDTQEATKNSLDWENIEYVVNRTNPTDSVAYLEKSIGGWDWKQVGEVRYSVTDNVLQIEIPRKLLGLDGFGDPEFNFKWADNTQNDGDILDFYQNGDVAPGGRFMFHFTTKSYDTINPFVLGGIIAGVLVIASITAGIIIKKKKNV